MHSVLSKADGDADSDGFRQKLCADMQDFNLHAAVHGDAEDRKALEQLCHYKTQKGWPESGCDATRPAN